MVMRLLCDDPDGAHCVVCGDCIEADYQLCPDCAEACRRAQNRAARGY